jgi:ADP-ribosylglycohydrolase
MNGIEPTKCGLSDENSNGNGSLMRILPNQWRWRISCSNYKWYL